METRYKNKDRTNTTKRKCFSAKTIDMFRIRFFCSYSACLQSVSEVMSLVFLLSVQAFNLFQNSGRLVFLCVIFVLRVFCSCFQSVSEFLSFVLFLSVHAFNHAASEFQSFLFVCSCVQPVSEFLSFCLFVVMASTCFRIAAAFFCCLFMFSTSF